MGSLIAPKIIRGGKEGLIKFKQVSEEDIPEKKFLRCYLSISWKKGH